MPTVRACRGAGDAPRDTAVRVRRPALPPAAFAGARTGCLQ